MNPYSIAWCIRDDFLSCLYGSERTSSLTSTHRRFLSCLYGSEQKMTMINAMFAFLSCLYGSELDADGIRVLFNFLSCLYGSEQLAYQTKSLNNNSLAYFLEKYLLFYDA